jgi:hypothetical protein
MEVDHKPYAGTGDGFGDVTKILMGCCQRLLDDDVFTCAGSLYNDLSMSKIRSHYGYRVDFIVAQHLPVVGINVRHAIVRCCFAPAFLVEVAYRGQARAGMCAVGIGMDLAPCA